MKAYIDDVGKRVYIDPSCSPDDAYFLGYRFGSDYAALYEAGWSLWFKAAPTYNFPTASYREVRIEGAHSLAERICEGPPCTHSCPRHPKREATG